MSHTFFQILWTAYKRRPSAVTHSHILLQAYNLLIPVYKYYSFFVIPAFSVCNSHIEKDSQSMYLHIYLWSTNLITHHLGSISQTNRLITTLNYCVTPPIKFMFYKIVQLNMTFSFQKQIPKEIHFYRH